MMALSRTEAVPRSHGCFPSPSPTCPFLPPSCFQREPRGRGEIFFQVGETRIFISAKKQCSEYFPFINALRTLEEKKKRNTLSHTKVGGSV